MERSQLIDRTTTICNGIPAQTILAPCVPAPPMSDPQYPSMTSPGSPGIRTRPLPANRSIARFIVPSNPCRSTSTTSDSNRNHHLITPAFQNTRSTHHRHTAISVRRLLHSISPPERVGASESSPHSIRHTEISLLTASTTSG